MHLRADARAVLGASLAGAPVARAMARLIAPAGRSFGMERSARLRRGRIEPRRILMSQALRCFSPVGLDALAEGIAALGLPPTAWRAGAAGAAFVHLGHEAALGAEGETCKLYLEHRLPRAPEGAPLVHEAWKWRRGQPARRDLYRLLPPEAARARLDAMAAAPGAEGRIAAALRAWLPAEARPFALDVAGEGASPRRSLDLRLYGMRMPVAALAPVLAVAAEALALEAAALGALLAERGAERLGHVALGLGEDGGAFLTVYGGAMDVPADSLA